MVCTSGSVQTVADKTEKAAEQVKKLQDMLEKQSGEAKTKFEARISESLTDAKIDDARLLSENHDVKTEYTSEFSLDKIAAVVKGALQAAAAATDPSVPNPAMSKDAIAAYSDLVDSVAEAAKSSSTSSSSLSYSMTRLSKGMFAFLYATSVNIKDEDTFGSEAVTSTAIYYRFVQSIDDVKNGAKFDEAIIDSDNLIKLKKIQAGLTDELASGAIDIDTWTKKDTASQAAIDRVKERLKNQHWSASAALSLHAPDTNIDGPHSFRTPDMVPVVQAALTKLRSDPDRFGSAISRTEQRLACNYW